MRYLALLLLAPWLAVLGWAYASYPKSLPRTRARRIFDSVVLLLALAATVVAAGLGYETVELPETGPYGRASGEIWQQVLPALYGYGAFVGVLLLGLIVRSSLWRRSRR